MCDVFKVEGGMPQNKPGSFNLHTDQPIVKATLSPFTASSVQNSVGVCQNDVVIKVESSFDTNACEMTPSYPQDKSPSYCFPTFQAHTGDGKGIPGVLVEGEIKTGFMIRDESITLEDGHHGDIVSPSRTMPSKSHQPAVKKDSEFNNPPNACDDSPRQLDLKECSYTSEKGYVCGFCNLRARSRSHLKRHLMIHTGEKPYACDMCDFKTSALGSLKRHKLIHAGSNEMFTCGECNFETGDHRNLQRHIRTHTGEKPYACDICDYKTGNAGTLKVHRRLHTGVKPYSCDLCTYKTADVRNLKRHNRTHTGETPYACGLCKYRTSHLFHLKRHMKRHAKSI